MKSLSLSLVFILLITPLFAGDNQPKPSRPSGTDANIGTLLGIGAVFVGIYLYEWYTQPKTVDPVENTKIDTQKIPEYSPLASIPLEAFPPSFRDSSELRLIISQRDQDLKNDDSKKQIKEEPLRPTGPILPPPPLTQLPFPEEKPIMTSAAKASALKTTPQNSTKRNNKTAVEANDPFN